MTTAIWLSNEAGTGGSATSQAQHIAYLADHCADIILVDENPMYTLAKVPTRLSARIRVMQIPLWTDPRSAKDELKQLLAHGGSAYIVLNNPGVLVRYYDIIASHRRQHKSKIVCTLHGGMLTMTARRYALEWAASLLFPRTDNVTYVSDFTRRYWERRYPWMKWCRANVVHNGVEIPAGVEPRTVGTPLCVGFVGRLLSEKDPDLFCRIAEDAQRRMLPFEFHVFGDGPLGTELRTAFAHVGITWHGVVPKPAEIYSRFDVLLMTSPIENCPYAVLEAKSYGVPVVAPSVGGIPEIVEDGYDGILAKTRTVGDLTAALIDASRLYPQLSQGCIEGRERYEARELCRKTWENRGLQA